jgi:hypothetical protein
VSLEQKKMKNLSIIALELKFQPDFRQICGGKIRKTAKRL